jgi:hypothetical protein
MRIFAVLLVISGFASIVGAAVYGASQVSPGTWDYAVIIVSTGIGVLAGGGGVAKVVAAFHRPADKHLTQIDKAVFLERGEGRDVVPW